MTRLERMRNAIVVFALATAATSTTGCDNGRLASADASVPPPRDIAAAAPTGGAAEGGVAVVKEVKVVLRAARLIAPRTGAITAPAFVTIDGDTITRVADSAPEDAPAVTDLGDITLTPGLIDAHTHLLHEESPAEEGSMVAEAASMSDADRALRGARFAREMLRAGFTTVRDLGNSGHGADVAMREAIAKGWIDGPRMIVSARALAPPGGQFPRLAVASYSLIDREYAIVRGVDDARALVAQTLYEGADCIKVIVDHGAGRVLGDAELRAIVDAAHRSGKKVAAHALTGSAGAAAVAAGVDSIEHGYELSDATLGEMAKKKIFLVPTDYPLDYYTPFAPSGAQRAKVLDHLKKHRERLIDRMKRARKLHVRIAAGSDAYTKTAIGDRGREASLVFSAYAEAGMSPLEILQSATNEAADLLGLPDTATSMTAGGAADLAGFQGDPSRDVTALGRVVVVVKGGKIVRGGT